MVRRIDSRRPAKTAMGLLPKVVKRLKPQDWMAHTDKDLGPWKVLPVIVQHIFLLDLSRTASS